MTQRVQLPRRCQARHSRVLLLDLGFTPKAAAVCFGTICQNTCHVLRLTHRLGHLLPHRRQSSMTVFSTVCRSFAFHLNILSYQ